MLIVNLYILY